ncbi:MAG: hypothetical protein K2W95_27855 [Candidatus Obscuribacterales bacterium]|nr:hypothetical protein [Candidatus Obscuribacterales bacterium]
MADDITIRPRKGLAERLVVACLVVAVPIAVFFIGTAEHRLWLAKGLVSLMFIVLGLVSLVVLSNAQRWREELMIAESQMDIMRDEVLVAGMMARAQMADARERLRRDPEKEQSEIVASLMKQAMPLITLVMKKERSYMTWGLAGFKLMRSVIRYLSNKA